jgi:hypothetical protein
MKALKKQYFHFSLQFILFVFLMAFCPKSSNKIYYSIHPNSKLFISGTTNVNTFQCNCTEPLAKGSFTLKELESNQGIFKCNDAWIKVKTESFDCRNRLMNRDLYKAMKSTQYPFISIQLIEISQYSVQKFNKKGEWLDFKAKVIVTLTHVSKTLQIEVRGQHFAPNQFHFLAKTDLRMTDFDITPPTAGLGLIKVRDKITVNLDIYAKVEE